MMRKIMNVTKENKELAAASLEISNYDVFEFAQFKKSVENSLNLYEIIPEEELIKHLTDDIDTFERYGLFVLSAIAEETRDTLKLSKVRDLSEYKAYISKNISGVFVCYKKYLASLI